MKEWIPLFQTTLWVGLIVFVCVYFKSQVSKLLDTLSKRVEAGDNIKVGSFEIGQSVKPIDKEERQDLLEKEVSESCPDVSENIKTEKIQKYLQVEEAVLNSLQVEYGALINRQVSAGNGANFDGFFVSDNYPFGIEVKYVSGKHIPIEKYVELANSIHTRIRSLGWKKFNLIFVVVFDEQDRHFRAGLNALRKALNNIEGKTILRSYRYEHLDI